VTECVSNVVSNVESAVACLAPSESSCLSLFFIVFILISHGHKSGACLLPALFSIRVSLDWFLLVVHRARVCLDNFERQSFWAICLVEYRPVTVA